MVRLENVFCLELWCVGVIIKGCEGVVVTLFRVGRCRSFECGKGKYVEKDRYRNVLEGGYDD